MCGKTKLLWAAPAQLGRRESVKKVGFRDSAKELTAGQPLCSEVVVEEGTSGL